MKRLSPTQLRLAIEVSPSCPQRCAAGTLEENFPTEEKQFIDEIAEKKKEAQRIADETKKKLDFNQKRDCYEPKV